jgi:hypothetical protein
MATGKSTRAKKTPPADADLNAGEAEFVKNGRAVGGIFDIASLREVKHYFWREVDRGEDRPPLKVKLLDLNIREAEAIPSGIRTPLRDAMQAMADYVVEWDLQAEDTRTGKVVPVPAPGSAEAKQNYGEDAWQLFEVLDDGTVSLILVWLKNPSYMEAKEKNSKASASMASPQGASEQATT